ncbi:MAG: hypothetical protein KGK00_13440 [Paracoccaceae bacterium]|nr:hypothetical protein [Paracoccaceae bacterium]
MARASHFIARLLGNRQEVESPFEIRLAQLGRAFARPHRNDMATVFRSRPSRRAV